MTSHIEEAVHGNVLKIHLGGTLSKEDYAKFVPDTEALIHQYGKIRILVMLEDFHGWDVGALWEDIKWDAKHFKDIERVAVVGEQKWHRWMAGFCKPFTTAEVRYFDQEQLSAARLWVEGA